MILEQKVFGFSLLSAAIIGYILCVLGISLYRVFFHPLSKYPGPKLAAATVWYQTYYDVWMGGELAHQVKKLHKKYGQIVRVGPNELHFSEPEVYHEIYSSNSRMIKDEFMYQCFGENDSSFGFIDPNLSRRRREVLSPLLSS